MSFNRSSVVVLDRDGVINEDSPDFIKSPDEWHAIPGSIAAIARLHHAGITVVIATNQSGLGRGYFGLDELEAIHAELNRLVEEAGGTLAGIFYCPHLPDAGCDCRKPATGLLTAMEAELGESPRGAWFVGDSLKDLQAAQAYGCRPALVRTGKGRGTEAKLAAGGSGLTAPEAIPVFDNLASCAEHILST